MAKSKRRALIIGNSQYDHLNLPDLTTPVRDADDLARVLRDPNIGQFDDVQVLLNKTGGQIRMAVAELFDTQNRDDFLLLYYSGHGIRDEEGKLYLATKDTLRRYLRATSVPASFIRDEMEGSFSRRQVLILDCCHSGAFAKSALGDSVGTKDIFKAGYGFTVLTATDAIQLAWEGDKIVRTIENSLFTHYLVEGLETGLADRNSDGDITLDEWYEYAEDKVREQTSRQTPQKWNYKSQGKLLVARNPRFGIGYPSKGEQEKQQVRNELKPTKSIGERAKPFLDAFTRVATRIRPITSYIRSVLLRVMIGWYLLLYWQ